MRRAETEMARREADLLAGRHQKQITRLIALVEQGTAHGLLSDLHPDTLPAAVVRGDLVYGNSTPKWARLPKAAGVLVGDGADLAWSASPTLSHLTLTGLFADKGVGWGGNYWWVGNAAGYPALAYNAYYSGAAWVRIASDTVSRVQPGPAAVMFYAGTNANPPVWTEIGRFTTTGLKIGIGAAGVDYALTFDGESSDGTITWMEDEAYWSTSHPFRICNAYTLASADGASGSALVTNGAGVVSWSAVGPSYAPIGSVVAWLKTLTGTPALPANWVECNGQTISDAASPYNGVTIPNLNASGGGTQRFLRGATTSGGTGGTESHSHSGPSHDHSAGSLVTNSHGTRGVGIGTGATVLESPTGAHTISGTTGSASGTTGSDGTLPSYYQVVWILRIK